MKIEPLHDEIRPCSREKALRRLRALSECRDAEVAHAEADEILLSLVADAEVREAFEAVRRWYA